MKSRLSSALTLALVWLLSSLYLAHFGVGAGEGQEKRPAAWAVPIARPGLPNLHRVSGDLYRGAQPTAEGMLELKKMGVKTVVNLRSFDSDKEEIADTGLALVEIPMKAWHAETEDAVRFLRIVTDKAKTPVFVHCQQGADRTGTMCAIYRIVVQGWTRDEAIREMTLGGFGHHSIFKNLRDFLRGLDIEAIKKDAGLSEKAVPGR